MDTGLRVGELVAFDWEYLDLDAEPGELYLPSEIQKGNPGASYLDLALAIGLGIVLGLGGRDYVAENIDDWVGKASTEMDSSDTRPETRGSDSSASGTDPDPEAEQ